MAALLLGGCSQPPLLSLSGRVCDAAPQLAAENQVPFGSAGGATVVLDANSRCVETPEGPATYAVFALPAAAGPYQITVRSRPRGISLLWPEATIYGQDNGPRRSITAFRSAAGAVVASARGEAGDRYVVVTSTPDTVGRREEIPTAANPAPIRLAATVIVPVIIPATPIGPTSNVLPAVLAHSGAVTVSAMPFVTVP